MVKLSKIYKNFNIQYRHQNSIILIGNFDGVHLGHQKLILLSKKFRKKYSLKVGVLFFEPMPKMFFNNKLENFRISSLEQKIDQLKNLEVDFVIIKKFNKKFSKTKSISFIKEILGKKLNPKFIFVSNNFRFGNKREGNVRELKNYEKLCKYKIVKPQPLLIKKKIISSSLIRKYLLNGNLSGANKLLKRKWSIDGKVQKGRQLGKKIGFPTCNIDIKDYVLAKPGVYSVKIYRKNNNFPLKGIANLGYRPTFNQKKILLEVNIFNFSRNLYNKKLTVEFIKFIRGERKFNGINQLRKQIQSDIKIAKKN